MCISVLIIVPVDDPAPLGARTSAGTMMTRIGLHIYPGQALEGWNRVKQNIDLE